MLERIADAPLQSAPPFPFGLELHAARVDLIDVVVDEQPVGRIRLLRDEVVDVVVEARGRDAEPAVEIVLDDDFRSLVRLGPQARVGFRDVRLLPVQLVRVGRAERVAVQHLQRRRSLGIVDQRHPGVGRAAEGLVAIVADAQVQQELWMYRDLVLCIQCPILRISTIVEILHEWIEVVVILILPEVVAVLRAECHSLDPGDAPAGLDLRSPGVSPGKVLVDYP
jgi:hypothetical protein